MTRHFRIHRPLRVETLEIRTAPTMILGPTAPLASTLGPNISSRPTEVAIIESHSGSGSSVRAADWAGRATWDFKMNAVV